MDRCFEFAAASCVLPREVGHARESELLNDLKYENGSSSVSGDCKRNVSNHSDPNKLKISLGDQTQRSSHYVEKSGHGQITVLLDRSLSRETRQKTHNENHKNSGTTVTRCHRIETSCTLRYGETTESISNLISIRRDQLIIRYSSRARDFIADFASTIMHIIVVRSGIASNEWWDV